MSETAFQIVERVGGLRAAEDATGIPKSSLHRMVTAEVGIQDRVLDAFAEAYGDGFDRQGTVLEWDARRKAARSSATETPSDHT